MNVELYQVRCEVRIDGPLNRSVFKMALEKAVRRHEVLRTTFMQLQEMLVPLQVIQENSTLSFQEEDLTGLPPDEQEARVAALLGETQQQVFDLNNGPVCRFILATLERRRRRFLIQAHAMCADRTTLRVLVEDIIQFYDLISGGSISQINSIQYIDIAQWQNEISSEIVGEGGFWSEEDRAELTRATLLARNLNHPPGFDHDKVGVLLSVDRVTLARALAQKYGASIPAFFLACYQFVLWQMTGQSSQIVGIACDGRNYDELKRACGPLQRYIPISCHITDADTLAEAIAQAQSAIDRSEKLQDCMDWGLILGDERLSYIPFHFEYWLRPPTCVVGDLTFQIDREYNCTDPFLVKLSCVEQGSALLVEMYYDPRSYQVEVVLKLLQLFETVIDLSVLEPDKRYRELIRDYYKAGQTSFRTETGDDRSHDRCVHLMIEDRSERYQDRVALICDQRHLTFGELSKRSNQLAHYLQRFGIGPESRIALYLDRNVETVLCMLAALKVGAAYIPIDTAMPRERVSTILAEIGVEAILTQGQWLASLPDTDKFVICLDAVWPAVCQQRDEAPATLVTPQCLAYVLPTSGSTGKPKGVAVEHRQLSNYVNAILEKLQPEQCSTFALASTFAADLGNTVTFPSLCAGGTLHILTQELLFDSHLMNKYFRERSIDYLKIVPSHLAALLKSDDPKALLPRCHLVLGGESLSWELLDKLWSLSDSCKFWNHYGPTETTVGVLVYQVKNSARGPFSTTVPLGFPLANTQTYVLDEELRPCSIWGRGELYIGGSNITRGYLNQPLLTAERFLPDPFSHNPGARLYRTGDVGRLNSEDAVEFIGRLDHQVKLRGYRIELGEIEAVLERHPSVHQAVVVLWQQSGEDSQLLGYVVLRSEATTEQLYSYLREQLPGYMVPRSITLLNQLPLMPHGKVDRDALPIPETIYHEPGKPWLRPRDLVELELIRIWEDTLRIHPIGLRDNFFQIGGHSFQAITLAAHIQQKFGRYISVASVLQAGNIENLAILLRSDTPFLPAQSCLIPIQQAGERYPFFCVHPGGGSVFCYLDLARNLGGDQPFYGLQAPGLYAEREPYSDYIQLAAHYVEAVQSLRPKGPYFLGGWSSGGKIALEMAQQLVRGGFEVGLLAIFDASVQTSHQSGEIEESDDAAMIAMMMSDLFTLDEDHLRTMTLDDQLTFVVNQAKEKGIIPPDYGLLEARCQLQVYRSNLRASRRYLAKRYPGRIALYLATQIDGGLVSNLAESWEQIATGGIQVHLVPGDHSSMMTDQSNVQALAEQLRLALDEAQATWLI
jgi:amino acid adenylation domain-containing protein